MNSDYLKLAWFISESEYIAYETFDIPCEGLSQNNYKEGDEIDPDHMTECLLPAVQAFHIVSHGSEEKLTLFLCYAHLMAIVKMLKYHSEPDLTVN